MPPESVPAVKKRAQQYIAHEQWDNGHYYKGTLDEIMSEMEAHGSDPTEFDFSRIDPVKVKFVKKLTLEVEDGNS